MYFYHNHSLIHSPSGRSFVRDFECSCAPNLCLPPHLYLSIVPPPCFGLCAFGHQATGLTCRPMFPWARGPLGASQQATLPASSVTGRKERVLVAALKVNEAAARHSVSNSCPRSTTSHPSTATQAHKHITVG